MSTVKRIETAKGKLIYVIFSTTVNGKIEYGIQVTSKIFESTEIASVSRITSDLEFAEKLLALLADNLVLPSTLSEVVEDYVAAAFTV